MTREEYLNLTAENKNKINEWFKAEGSLGKFDEFLKRYCVSDGVVMLRESPNLARNSEETVSGKNRYGGGSIETIDYIESVTKCWIENGVPPDMIFNLGQALKYLSSRLGKKDDIYVELGKAHNYLYRAINKKWFEE